MRTGALLAALVLSLATTPPAGGVSDRFKKLKEKAKLAYKNKFGRGKTWHFLDHDLASYPGTNEKYRQINKEKWDAYYSCLTTSNGDLGRDQSMVPKAVQGFESGSIELECSLCLSPDETFKLDSVEWKWAAEGSEKFESVEFTEHVLLSLEDRTLRIYNLQVEHSGQYVCQIGAARAPPHFLTVVANTDDDLIKVHSHEAPLPPYPQKPERIEGHDLLLDTHWGPWSQCSKCNQIGRRYRLGYCTVTYQKNDKNSSVEAKTEGLGVTEKDYELLRIFKFGMPCASHILPRSMKKLAQLQKRRDEVMSGYCKGECEEAGTFEVKDKNGNVIEQANNSAGIYSMLQGLPSPEPPVERTLLFAAQGKPAVLTCPGNLNSDTPMQWQMGPKKIVPELLSKESNGRIYVSITDKIHIKKAKVSDSNVYSCWQHQSLAGTVRLMVEKKISLNFNHHIMLLGMVLISLTFLYVFAKALFGRKRNKK